MSQLSKPISVETAFGVYTLHEVLGEGGAGRVYGGVGPDRLAVAVKVLARERTTEEKRSRFKNEVAFLQRNKHVHIVTVLDHGVANNATLQGPFYVMKRYDSSLRTLMEKGIPAYQVLRWFSQILDGVEAAHLQGVVHRDLKPENILYNRESDELAIADFGIARFTEDFLATTVETTPSQRLANFQYAAPEQRSVGKPVGIPADIYALGLLLNEMVTAEVPHGTDYRTIGSVAKELAFLDDIVARMRKQQPAERLSSIQEVKTLIQRSQYEAVSLQRISELGHTVVKAAAIDDPLAHEPPKLVDFTWDGQILTLILDRNVSHVWVQALGQMDSTAQVMDKPPQAFTFQGNQASVPAEDFQIQSIINHFKGWLPQATSKLKFLLEQSALREERESKERLRLEREAEERRLRVMKEVKI